MRSSCDLKDTLCLGGGETLALGVNGDSRPDGGLERGLEDGVTMVGVGVLEGYLASGLTIEASKLLSFDIHTSYVSRERNRSSETRWPA